MITERVRNIRTIEGDYPVYRNAEIEVRTMKPDELKPTSRYVLSGKLEKIEEIEGTLEANGFSIFDLNDVLECEGMVVAPPLVESDGDVDCIVDGLHRLWLARIEGRDCKVIYVSKVDQAKYSEDELTRLADGNRFIKALIEIKKHKRSNQD